MEVLWLAVPAELSLPVMSAKVPDAQEKLYGTSGTVECHGMTSVNAMWSRRNASGILTGTLTY